MLGDIIKSVAEFGTTFVDVVFGGKRVRYDRLPDWMSPGDFKKNDRTADIILIGLILILTVIVISIAIKGRKAVK